MCNTSGTQHDNISQVTLDISSGAESIFGEYVLVAGNADGVSDGLVELRSPATDSHSYTSSVRRTSVPMMGVYGLSLLVVYGLKVLS